MKYILANDTSPLLTMKNIIGKKICYEQIFDVQNHSVMLNNDHYYIIIFINFLSQLLIFSHDIH